MFTSTRRRALSLILLLTLLTSCGTSLTNTTASVTSAAAAPPPTSMSVQPTTSTVTVPSSPSPTTTLSESATPEATTTLSESATSKTITTGETTWTHQQFATSWNIAYPDGWTVNTAGVHEGALELQGMYADHIYRITLNYPIGIAAQSLEQWATEQLANAGADQKTVEGITDVTVAEAQAKKALNVPAYNNGYPTHTVYVWRKGTTNPRTIVIAQVDERPFDAAAMEGLLDRFVAEIRP